ncbi:hypothetical protein KDD17_05695 [Sulfitobacter albidus]|uniref:Leucine-rich repeat domain-containing protein n=1 Tax=Sulfitobacter albidus TaxID=2829501 RepID=A0A975JFU3_9RHOB|nr:hypothetical protein [Sulfitobacter albidus]QUJ77485.1 hypothetical protein KDD17_05695 [Sulfitobacter albidus]
MTADEAYAEAERRIEEHIESDEDMRSISFGDLEALEEIPPLIRKVESLFYIDLENTQVANIDVLSGFDTLEILNINLTRVTDLKPVETLINLTDLYITGLHPQSLDPLSRLFNLELLHMWDAKITDLSALTRLHNLMDLNIIGTEVEDLRPIAGISFDSKGKGYPISPRIEFRNTKAVEKSEDLRALSEIIDDRERTEKTLAYLRSLPPYPEPLPWEATKPKPPITASQLIDQQDAAGWRFSPVHGAMALFIEDTPLQKRQETLATLCAERIKNLLEKLGDRTNSGGLRQEVAEEAARFEGILGDTGRSLSERSLELWASLIALGGHLEEQDRGRVEGRDPLDLLPGEARTALQTFLGLAGNLVRSFPDVRAMDDGQADFTRQQIPVELILSLLQRALETKFVDPTSGALIQHVSKLAKKSGVQADKAYSTTAKGGRNLAYAAILTAPFLYGADGVASGILNDIGTDISDHYELSERAIEFLEASEKEIEQLLKNSPPDEAAQMRSLLNDLMQQKGPR